jgi:enediyne biosynthesis protein E5
MTAATRAVRVGDRSVPVILPNRKDARLHTAAVIITIHVVGITALGFEVSVPQIIAAIVTAGLIDVVMTFRSTGMLVWPASGMLTGSGVALILRLVGMESGDYWSWTGWYWYAAVAGVSILTKYLIRYRGSHLFNPSNVGLVAAFLILGSGLVEPLDFWWAPPGFWTLVAYAVIIGGGILITRRLHLLEMAVVFWGVLAAGLAVLSLSGHCMIATWSPTPVCGERFWTALVSSPEIHIFLFFMITDPKTIPQSRRARVAFAFSLALFTTLMIAPHTVEYGAKVGLLASLVLWSPLRWLHDRLLPTVDPGRSGIAELIEGSKAAPRVSFARGMAAGSALALVVAGIVAAGIPARGTASAATPIVDFQADIDPASLPEVVVDGSVQRIDIDFNAEYVDLIAVTLAENLAIEAEAMRVADGSLLGLADGGERLDEMQARLDTAIATGERRVDEYRFDTLALKLHEAPEGQVSAGLVVDATGSVDRVVYDPSGVEQERSSEPFTLGFVLRQLGGDRWVIVDVVR